MTKNLKSLSLSSWTQAHFGKRAPDQPDIWRLHQTEYLKSVFKETVVFEDVTYSLGKKQNKEKVLTPSVFDGWGWHEHRNHEIITEIGTKYTIY